MQKNAQLRASVFLALEEVDPDKQKVPFVNPDLKKYLSTSNGALAFNLILDFLEHFKLEFTNAVFTPECSMKGERETSTDLRDKLHISSSSPSCTTPVLDEVISRLQGDNVESTRPKSLDQDLTKEQLEQAKKRFNYYDQDKNGVIDKEELRCLFIDTFPTFNRNMLDRYVNDEFRAADRDFSSSIDFNEFVGMYRRLFLQCRSVVSDDVKELVHPKQLARPKSDVNHKSLFEEIAEDTRTGTKEVKGGAMTPDDIIDDPFFDDVLPAGPGNKPLTSSRPSSEVQSTSSEHTLTDMRSIHSDRKPASKSGDSKHYDIEYVPTDDYEDDFSSIHSVSVKSGRSQKSSHRIESIGEEIEEFIDEDISIECDDLLKSHSSAGFDDLTTDQTISQQDNGFDYAEDMV